MNNKEGYLYGSCFRLRPQKKFSKRQITKKHRKNGHCANHRFCFQCMLRKDIIQAGTIVDMASDEPRRVRCLVCLQLRFHFCIMCHWCAECAQHPTGRTYRKNAKRFEDSPDGMITLVNGCVQHEYEPRSIFVPTPRRVLFDYYESDGYRST